FKRALDLEPAFAEARAWNDHIVNRQNALAAAQPAAVAPQQAPPPDMRLASVPTTMQRPGVYTGAPKPGSSGMQPPTPDAVQQMADVPMSMQRPVGYGGPLPMAAPGASVGQSAIPPSPDNLNSEIRSLPPVQ